MTIGTLYEYEIMGDFIQIYLIARITTIREKALAEYKRDTKGEHSENPNEDSSLLIPHQVTKPGGK